MVHETKIRSIAKATSYRVLGTISTMMLVWIVTGEAVLAIGVGGAEGLSKIILYFFHERVWNKLSFGKKELRPAVIWLTGLPGSGKTTLGNIILNKLKNQGMKVELLDGESIRNFFPSIGFSEEDRHLHITRVGHLASLLEKNGLIVVVTMVSPFEKSRSLARKLCQNFIEIHISTPLEVCEKNDKLGNYEKARRGEIQNFTGVNQSYEIPQNPDMKFDLSRQSMEDAAERIIQRSLKVT